jgi:hypothetical protein
MYCINKELHTSRHLRECMPYLFYVIYFSSVAFITCFTSYTIQHFLLNLENVLCYVLHYCLESMLVFIKFIDLILTLIITLLCLYEDQ